MYLQLSQIYSNSAACMKWHFYCSLVYHCVAFLLNWDLNFCIPQRLYLQFFLLCLIVLDWLPHFSQYIWKVFVLHSSDHHCYAQRKYQPVSSSHQLTVQSLNVQDHLWAMFVQLKAFYIEIDVLVGFFFFPLPIDILLLILLSHLTQYHCDMYWFFCLFRGIHKQII